MRSSTASVLPLLCSLLCSLLIAAFFSGTTYAAEDSSPPSKPIVKDTLPIKIKPTENADGESKPKSKSSAKSAAAQHDKEEMEADELADKIAKKMAELHKENERIKAQTPMVRHPRAATSASAVSPGMPHGANLAADNIMHFVPWSYDGEGGPLRWGKIDPANAKCDTGERQSPIDIRDGIRVDLEPVIFDYKPTRFNVVDTGHTIQVNLGAGSTITILGRRYELTQFHFHKPSEERVNGRNYEMVAHLVHKDIDGKLVMLAVLIEQGKANSLIQTIWNNMPLEKNDTVQPSGTIDMYQILPANRQYYTYMGSLTTPPCTEGVLWVVFKEPIEASQDQISIFSRMYPMNARPIQNSAGRLIKESN
ncbi:carbonic anhydrase [Solimicrobium silvestre]|uniref:carbonic anhydrase n=1 Tax=Solimicrobium silvestre TaxID=2099400 RepID=A0A2S9H170_9BURK|nr:carbonic anhydrase family protein [Solimicrobium silvestre]PRC93734.1 Eukaryotic-type carbonic anhydrase [Solimicrobium silvestre]